MIHPYRPINPISESTIILSHLQFLPIISARHTGHQVGWRVTRQTKGWGKCLTFSKRGKRVMKSYPKLFGKHNSNVLLTRFPACDCSFLRNQLPYPNFLETAISKKDVQKVLTLRSFGNLPKQTWN